MTVNVKASPVEARRPGGRALQRLRAHPLETIGLVGVVFAVFMGIFGPCWRLKTRMQSILPSTSWPRAVLTFSVLTTRAETY